MLEILFQLLFYSLVSFDPAVFDKEYAIQHSQSSANHSQGEVVHETKLLFDDRCQRVANVKSYRKHTIQKCYPTRSTLIIRNVSYV